ncbi:MAG: TonB family protein [Burkholderiales bacterium]|nr:TonB family protein [Burkholderiales bacterium]
MNGTAAEGARAAARPLLALALSLFAHVLILTALGHYVSLLDSRFDPKPSPPPVLPLQLRLEAPSSSSGATANLMPPPPRVAERTARPPVPRAATSRVIAASAKPASAQAPAFMEAPPPPSAEDWALASTYTLKNSKRYRFEWGRQVRSMMGTAYAGVDQGVVRLRVEIAPDGRVARVETLWSTSAKAERLALDAIARLPALPPTPTGRPLVFERTISFQPYETEETPIYRRDCFPDPPVFSNPYAWNGNATPTIADTAPAEKLDAAALAECRKQLPVDSIEAEVVHDRRQHKQWRSSAMGHN